MAWAKATIQINSASVGTGIKVSLKRTNKSSARMTFTISDAVGKGLGWSAGDKIEVMIGEGEHHGLLRLRKNNSAGQADISHRQMAKGAWFTLKLGYQPSFINRSEAPAWCQWEKVEEGWVELVLPKWADETSPTKKPSAPPPQEPAKRGPGRPPSTNVTASLMGDPSPNRREMLARFGEMKA